MDDRRSSSAHTIKSTASRRRLCCCCCRRTRISAGRRIGYRLFGISTLLVICSQCALSRWQKTLGLYSPRYTYSGCIVQDNSPDARQ
ncbi:hypothetical protein M431DRAFT_242250 [Trichoderma harzianum CBS 226.95]|uniref:Uncharacterized protein n=1 Tax=Trichoderma harzianum CBS 226.95 TaxID=983964 RepID=A0A2T4A2Z6_TRIHA|nr:hypothetical protein M431DRAFT_242250 [Trichoderma harzianum CBS 226.95]PTB51445.1 hypothetical protein M431DRAFT_242250 [Trichoderma harzianum CBS 226.95]